MESTDVGTTTSGTFVEYLSLTTGTVPAGKYRIGWSYTWSFNSTFDDFEGQVELDDTTQIVLHQQEPKDSGGGGAGGTNQRHLAAGFSYVIFTSSGSHTFDLDFASGDATATAAIHRGALEFWRVSD